MCMPNEEDRPEWRETDEWIVPKGLTSPDSPQISTETRRQAEPFHGPTLTRESASEAFLRRDGGR